MQMRTRGRRVQPATATTAATTTGARELTLLTIRAIPVATGQLLTLLTDRTTAQAKNQPTSGLSLSSKITVRMNKRNFGTIITMKNEALISTLTVGAPNQCDIKGMEMELEVEGVEQLEEITKGSPRENSIETDCR